MTILDSTKLVEIFVTCDDFQKNLNAYLVSERKHLFFEAEGLISNKKMGFFLRD